MANNKKPRKDYSAQYARYSHLMNSDLVLYGMFISVALVVSYLESLIPFQFPVPGIKLGLANAVIVWVLYVSDWKGAAAVSLLRVVIAGLLFGNLYTILFSSVGAILSLSIMTICKKYSKLKILGVSILGAVAHNVGQIVVAMIVLRNAYIIAYFPYLFASAVISGIAIGILSGVVYSKLRLAPSGESKSKQKKTITSEQNEDHNALKPQESQK